MALTEQSRTLIATRRAVGPVNLVVYKGTDQAVDTEISEAVPAGKKWRLIGLRFTLVTDANAVTRTVTVQISDSDSNVLWRKPHASTQIQSLTKNYNHGIESTDATDLNDEIEMRLPGITLGPGFVIATVTNNRQAGDNYGIPVFLVEEIG